MVSLDAVSVGLFTLETVRRMFKLKVSRSWISRSPTFSSPMSDELRNKNCMYTAEMSIWMNKCGIFGGLFGEPISNFSNLMAAV